MCTYDIRTYDGTNEKHVSCSKVIIYIVYTYIYIYILLGDGHQNTLIRLNIRMILGIPHNGRMTQEPFIPCNLTSLTMAHAHYE